MNKLEKQVLDIFSRTPIDILEEDEYQQSVMASERWYLSTPRPDGVSKGSTKIGYFNIWVAVKLIADANKKAFDDESNVDTLATICDNLTNYGVLRELPKYKREKFKLITNEELDVKRKARKDSNQSSND